MEVNYLYLDDEQESSVRPYLREITRHDESLNIELQAPINFEKQLLSLNRVIGAQYDGLILDMRLDQFSNLVNGVKTKVAYRASSLAQELRTRASENKQVDCPILLWSTDQRLQDSFRRDETSHDLYDLITIKDDILGGGKRLAKRLNSLAKGYKLLKKFAELHSNLKRVPMHEPLGFSERPDWLDPRILDHFEDEKVKRRPAHEYARFVLTELIDGTGPLIGRSVLLSRLGIRGSTSRSTLDQVFSLFEKASYTGVFSEGWKRWWEAAVDARWLELNEDGPPLRALTAKERCARLKAIGEIRTLTSAEPINTSYSTKFWEVCPGERKPIDPIDGFRVDHLNRHPWQRVLYVSLEGLRKFEREGGAVDPLERSRIERAKSKR